MFTAEEQKYIDKYISLCLKTNTGYSSADVAKHNRAMKRLRELCFELMEKPEITERIMPFLLTYEDERAQITAATHCLNFGIYVNKAMKILKILEKTAKLPETRLNAYYAMEIDKRQGYIDKKS